MKRFILLSAILFICLSLSAQRLGFVGGFQLNNHFVYANKCDFNTKPGAGFHLGAMFEYNFTHRLGFDIGAVYNLRHATYDILPVGAPYSTHLSRSHYYLDFPIHFFVDFPIQNNTNKLTLFLGPSFNIGLHASDVAWRNTDNKRPVGYDNEDMFASKTGHLYRFQIGGELGLAYKVKNHQCRVSYSVSLNNMNKNDFTYYVGYSTTNDWGLKEGQEKIFRDGVFRITYAYLFDLRK